MVTRTLDWELIGQGYQEKILDSDPLHIQHIYSHILHYMNSCQQLNAACGPLSPYFMPWKWLSGRVRSD